MARLAAGRRRRDGTNRAMEQVRRVEVGRLTGSRSIVCGRFRSVVGRKSEKPGAGVRCVGCLPAALRLFGCGWLVFVDAR